MKKSNMHKTAVDSTSNAPKESEILPAAILLKTLKNPNMIASNIEPISQVCILLQKSGYKHLLWRQELSPDAGQCYHVVAIDSMLPNYFLTADYWN
jgi:hypothetical protein